MNLIGVIIFFLNLCYLDLSHMKKLIPFQEDFLLIIISFLTILMTILRLTNSIVHQYLLKWEGIRLTQELSFRKYFLTIILVYLVHPNVLFKSFTVCLLNRFPFEELQMKVNYIFVAFQNTLILFEIMRRQLIPLNYFDEKQKYKVRKAFLGDQSFYFFFKYMFKFRSFHLIVTILLYMEFECAMLLKIFEMRENSSTEITLWIQSLWTVTQVSLNCGYGNIFPITYEGKIIGILTGVVGILLFSLIIASISDQS